MKQRKTNRIIKTALVLLLLAAMVLIPLKLSRRARAESYTVCSAQVEKGEILLTRTAGGVVQAGKPLRVEIPYGVKIKAMLVTDGDYVEEGQTIAEIDPSTAAYAALQVRQSMNEVEMELAYLSSKTSAETLYAPADGRAKAIYAIKDSPAEEAMLRNGALVALSLDGEMTVKVKTEMLPKAGSAVQVKCESGTVYDGKVRSIREGEFEVSISDDGPKLGAEVEVLDLDGDVLGTGTLQLSMPWLCVAQEGIVSGVYVKEEQKIKKGTRLISLKESGEAEIMVCSQRHKEYAEILQQLLEMERTGEILAPASGYVSEIDESLILKHQEYSEYTPDAAEKDITTYPEEQTTLLCISQINALTVKISVDEQDILDYQRGMQADVTISALRKTVTGVVSSIAAQADTENGRGKYTVEIDITKDKAMLPGMTASVSIRLGSTGEVLTIPIAALEDKGSRSFVYTSYNEKQKSFESRTEVSVGHSDGMNAEIRSGLEEGMTVWYKTYGS